VTQGLWNTITVELRHEQRLGILLPVRNALNVVMSITARCNQASVSEANTIDRERVGARDAEAIKIKGGGATTNSNATFHCIAR
jgi:hypothetical protein